MSLLLLFRRIIGRSITYCISTGAPVLLARLDSPAALCVDAAIESVPVAIATINTPEVTCVCGC